MTFLQTFREQFNISQAAFALLLGISTSQLSMVELGLRRLSRTADVKFTRLQLAFEAMQASGTGDAGDRQQPLIPGENELTIQTFRESIAESKYQLERTRRQLDPLIVKRGKAMATLCLVKQVRKDDAAGEYTPWANNMELEAYSRLNKASRINIELLEMKCCSLEKFIKDTESRMEELCAARIPAEELTDSSIEKEKKEAPRKLRIVHLEKSA